VDILAGMLAYVAGLGALFGAFAVAFMFVVTPQASLQTQAEPQSANAMLVRPSTAHKPNKLVEARARASARHSQNHATAPVARDGAQRTASARDTRRGRAASATQARRLTAEEHARRWAYQQDGSFASRFPGYSE
jgi:hypothetical protein